MWNSNASGEKGSGSSETVIAGLRAVSRKVSARRRRGKRIISVGAIEIADGTMRSDPGASCPSVS